MAAKLAFDMKGVHLLEGQQEVHDAIGGYLQPTPTETQVQVLTEIISFMDLESDEPDTDSHQERLWRACVHQAGCIPYNHPSQLKFARLVAQIMHDPRAAQTTIKNHQSVERSLWEWIQGPGYNVEKPVDLNVRREANEHAFVALLSAHDVGIDRFLFLRRLALALEENDPGDTRDGIEFTEETRNTASVRVAAAAVCILYNGPKIFQECRVIPEVPHEELPDMAGGEQVWIEKVEATINRDLVGKKEEEKWMAVGVANYSIPRWRFWAQRFRTISEYTEIEKEARGLASRAANYMDAINGVFSGL